MRGRLTGPALRAAIAAAPLGLLVTACADDRNPTGPAGDGLQVVGRLTLRTAGASGPLIRHARNARYFEDGSGRPVYLTGSHTWNNFQDLRVAGRAGRRFDFGRYLGTLAAAGHNFVRLWTWESTATQRWRVDLLPYRRTGPGVGVDGRLRYDLETFNEAYFERLRSRVRRAAADGFYVSVMLFQTFSVWSRDERGVAWEGHPFHAANNVNGVDGDRNGDGRGEEVHTLSDPAITRLQEAYVRRVVEAVHDFDNVLFEISNEGLGGSLEWQNHMARFVRDYETQLGVQHPVGITGGGRSGDRLDLDDMLASDADWTSPDARDGYRDNPPAAAGAKVMILDTDHLWGVGGDRKWVWKSFLRGHNPIFLDIYDSAIYDPNWGWGWMSAVQLEEVRRAMGLTAALARRVDMAGLAPASRLASTGYCMAGGVGVEARYLVYLPRGGSVTVDLSATAGHLEVTWIDPREGSLFRGAAIRGGASRSFSTPFEGDAVLYVSRQGLSDER